MILVGMDLVAGYDDRPVLREVDVCVERGETVAVLGTSGSGKSTLLHVLGGLMSPASGRVEVAGTDLYGIGSEERAAFRRQNVGFVFQKHLLVEDLPLIENAALPLMLDGLTRTEALDRVWPLLAEFGVDHLAWSFPDQVSGGEAQRAAVARAVVAEPVVVLADEPTGALDSENADLVLAALVEAPQVRKGGLLIVTHDAAIAGRCDRILYVRGGIVSAA